MGNARQGLNDEEKQLVLKMWADGISAGKISAEMTTRLRRVVTRNSIIGVIHRAGAQRYPSGSQSKMKDAYASRKPAATARLPMGRPRSSDGRLTVTKASPAPRVAVAPPPPPPPAQPRSIVRTKTRNVPLTEATHGGCRYEVTGSFNRGEYLFCNAPVQSDGKLSSFCSEHHALCWTKPDKRHKKLEQAAAITA